MIHTDTIAAIATAMGNSGIGIVRISGQEAVAVADRIFKEKGKQETLEGSPSHTIHYGYIYDGDQVVDEVLVMLMRGPRSFTAEDTVEMPWRHACDTADPGNCIKGRRQAGRTR